MFRPRKVILASQQNIIKAWRSLIILNINMILKASMNVPVPST